jgi:hypothetical protein
MQIFKKKGKRVQRVSAVIIGDGCVLVAGFLRGSNNLCDG